MKWDVADVLSIIRYLIALGRKLWLEKREATLAEMEAAGISRKAAGADLAAAIAEAEAGAEAED
jgi:hypothetical protein